MFKLGERGVTLHKRNAYLTRALCKMISRADSTWSETDVVKMTILMRTDDNFVTQVVQKLHLT